MSSEMVIVNPERFVAQFRPADLTGYHRNNRKRVRTHGIMCLDCLHGRHDGCSSDNCGCIHRELAVLPVYLSAVRQELSAVRQETK